MTSADHRLVPGSRIDVRLVKRVHPDVTYAATVVSDDGTHVIVRGPWAEAEARDLGFVRFDPGDVFTEHLACQADSSIQSSSGGRRSSRSGG